MSADKYETLVNGRETLVQATVVSAGAAQAGKIVALDTTGRLDVSILPVGVGPDVSMIVTSEALSAGDYVNIYNNAGTPNVRKADATNDRAAHGFVKSVFGIAASALVYFEGPNDSRSGLTPGARYYLSSAGGIMSTPPATPTHVIHQYVGLAVNSTTVNTDIDDEVVL